MFPEPEEARLPTVSPAARLSRWAGLTGIPHPVVLGVSLLAVCAVSLGLWRAVGSGATTDEFMFVAADEQAADVGEDAESPLVAKDADVPSTVWVHVAGAVARPGLYEVPNGGRVGDALAAAGGAGGEACVDAVNLARVLADGERIYVPTMAEVQEGGSPGSLVEPMGSELGGETGGAGGGLIDLNRAGEAELVSLPGVGPATAAKIVADREANGPFATPEDLMRVSGIGDKKFEALRELVTVR